MLCCVVLCCAAVLCCFTASPCRVLLVEYKQDKSKRSESGRMRSFGSQDALGFLGLFRTILVDFLRDPIVQNDQDNSVFLE